MYGAHLSFIEINIIAVSYTHLRAHETGRNLVCRLLLEKKRCTNINLDKGKMCTIRNLKI